MSHQTGIFRARYLKAYRTGLLAKNAGEALAALENCSLCPRRCGVNRLAGELGTCSTGEQAMISSYNPHFGEEAPLVGINGSGTIFFTNCNLLCSFCQNYEISHLGYGIAVNPNQLASIMLDLQERGCHNINFVTPSHVVPQILGALLLAVPKGLHLPLVFNTGGYDLPGTLAWLNGIVDIYMPDFKCWDPQVAEDFCSASDYPEVAREAIREMHRQVGDLVIGSDGIAREGILLRHLVLPEGWAGTTEIMRFLAREVSADTYVNIMAQYRPCFRANTEIYRGLKRSEFEKALDQARDEGIHRIDKPFFF